MDVSGKCLVHRGEQFMAADRRCQVVGGAQLHRTHGPTDVGSSIDDNQGPGRRPVQSILSIENAWLGENAIDPDQVLLRQIFGQIVPGDLEAGVFEYPRQ